MNLNDVYLHGICICDNNDFTDTFSILEKYYNQVVCYLFPYKINMIMIKSVTMD